MNKILLMGNPNVGKSAIFSRLTGAKVMISNYPGTTVEFAQGYVKIDGCKPVVIDVPGTYNLEATSKAEEVAVHMLQEGDLIINVVDATNLERNLYLTLQLLEKNIPVIVALNIWDDTKHKGINIDIKKLEQRLGVPVVPTCGLTGEGIKELIGRLPEAQHTLNKEILSDSQRWENIGKIIEDVQKLTHRHHTILERLEDLSIKPLTGLPIALIVVVLSFWVVRLIGEGLINYIFEPLFRQLWLPLMIRLGAFLGADSLLHHVFIGNLVNGQIDLLESFGVLTTGFFVSGAMVLPYIISFYLMLGLLEDFGYLPRLAVLVDNFMHHLGLHGYAIIPMILGLGCNVPGILAVRLLEGRREKFIAATLIVISVPCISKVAMIVGLVGQRGGQYVAIVFSTLFIILIVKGLLLNKFLKGSSPEILTEMPPYRIPSVKAVAKKLWMRCFSYLREALPYVLLGVLIVNILNQLRITEFLSNVFSPVLTGLWGLPKEAISPLMVGFLRKDVAIGMLAPLNLTTKQLVIGATVLSVYFPCMAAFVVLIRELGIKDMLKSTLIMLTVALVVGTVLNLVLQI
ncbi:MAG: ferrous iron transporter B [Candidatus Omnitrophica bacterium]|nr:ferrous iron transporter B [Candidatus Omnitrophota bacterium]